ncbi:MAG: LytS/YhcK type 5TM receptor domain-containing protein, partial [Bosea sp. (in: a-proteobacteria)]|nr:LytS/YhcK type 5TM receptor domain-containing protein [Bosea sp. (in: a-proteobacteria)]
MLINLVQSLFFLLFAGLLLTVIAPWLAGRAWLRSCVVGLLFAGGALVSMANPVVIQPGLVIDSRNTFAILAGPIGGPWAAVLTAVPLIIVRFLTGGVGMATGVSGIALRMLIGIGFSVWMARRRRPLMLRDLLLLCSLDAVCLLASAPLIPGDAGERFLHEAVPAMILVSTVGILLTGIVVINDSDRRETAYRLRTLIECAPGTLYQCLLRPDGRLSYQFASFSMDKILGISKEDVERDPEVWLGKMFVEDRVRFENLRREDMTDDRAWRFEGRYHTPSGGVVWLRSESTRRRL